MRKIAPNDKRNMRKIYAERVMNNVRFHGFSTLTIQDLAYSMKISRASLYNYFSSKEDVLTEVTQLHTTYLNESIASITNESLTYADRLWSVFEQTILSSVYVSDIFLNDLKTACPTLYEQKMNCKEERLEKLSIFYRNGMNDGIFHTLNPALLILQDESILKKLFYSDFLETHALSITQALYDYYVAKCTQMIELEYRKTFLKPSIQQKVSDLLSRIAIP